MIQSQPQTLFVCAAGNNNYDLDENSVYPACFELDNIISVAAIDGFGDLISTSGFGKSVDIAAPGDNILVALPEGDYDFDSGTSVAAAYVSGVAGLILSVDDSLSPNEIKQIIVDNGHILQSLKEKVSSESCIDAGACLNSLQNK